MKKQRILILGAGVSGLSLAWYLSRSSLPFEITILEKTDRAGGWLHTDHSTGFHFEKGPRTFKVDKSPFIVDLLHDLGLADEVVWSEERPHHRYVWMRNQLLRFPSNPFSFLFSPLTKGMLKALFSEWKKAVHYGDETVWNFVARRFNEDVARLLFDPLVVGIFGGDSRYISVRSCFPLLKQWEEEYGSVTKGFWNALKEKRKQSRFSSVIPTLPLSAMYSLNKGVGQLIETLVRKIPAEIHYRSEVTAVHDLGDAVEVVANDQTYRADALFCALPVVQTGFLLKSLAPDIAEKFSQIKSCSMTVISVGYTEPVLPVEGFGYLTSTQSKEDILGAVFDSSVIPQHNERPLETRLTIMLEDRGLSRESMVEVALQGIKRHLNIARKPDAISYKQAIHAIPQYSVGHLEAMERIQKELEERLPRFRFVGNYLSGVAVDQCIAHSKGVAQQWSRQHL